MGSPYVAVRLLYDGPVYRRGALLHVTAGQAHLWGRMGLAEPVAEQAKAAPVAAVERAVTAPSRRRGRRSRSADARECLAQPAGVAIDATEAVTDGLA